MSSKSRWFPDQPEPDQQFESGWALAGQERWDAEEHGSGVDLTSLRLHSPRSLSLEFHLDGGDSRVIEFAKLADLQIDGDLAFGLTDVGWEVSGTSTLVAKRPRADGLFVYALEMPTALLCFASLPGA
jgi:hypothetical protein